MMEELELYLDMLRGDLEVEVDLHGGRTEKSRTIRELIIYTERELAGLKTQDDELFGECDHCGKPYLLGGDEHNTVTGNHFECEVLSQVVCQMSQRMGL